MLFFRWRDYAHTTLIIEQSTMILVYIFDSCSYRLRGVECLDPFFTKIAKNRYKKHRKNGSGLVALRRGWDVPHFIRGRRTVVLELRMSPCSYISDIYQL